MDDEEKDQRRYFIIQNNPKNKDILKDLIRSKHVQIQTENENIKVFVKHQTNVKMVQDMLDYRNNFQKR